MYGTHDLSQVNRMQDEHRRHAAQARLAARVNKQEPRKSEPRRVFGLRVSFA